MHKNTYTTFTEGGEQVPPLAHACGAHGAGWVWWWKGSLEVKEILHSWQVC